MIRGFGDINKGKEESKSKKNSDFYTGGQASGLAVSSPDVANIVEKARQGGQDQSAPADPNEMKIRVTLWANGFSVDDGPFRDYNAPENQRFMAQMNEGRVPSELMSKTRGKPVSVELSDKRQEQYVPPPPPPYIAFSGQGSSVSNTRSQALDAVNAEFSVPSFDPNQPTTTVQIRFHNGQRKTLTLNLNARLNVIFDYVMMAAPVDGSFELVSGFPPRPLQNPSLTIQESGVAGSAVIQKLL
ncbi:unnamed protein product [Blepharisma stoltei]|uniref:NSFL1 cofactor p47 n=1 Tax=Blepharisma stoltei TaxID=1481888 RepID=A0AAU9J5Q6_9CILI|nr:unnamed protein product [Blepharisma stoltei]